jgi:hypothetical protein
VKVNLIKDSIMHKYNLSAETLAAIESEKNEAFRLYALTDTWLASALLKLAREAQKVSPEFRPEDNTYNARLIYGAVPELARRLGTVRLTMPEIDWELRELSDYELRERVGHGLLHVQSSDLPGWVMLTREVANGNPVVYAMDRICPGVVGNRDDRVTRRITELAEYRKKPYNGVWSPDVYA